MQKSMSKELQTYLFNAYALKCITKNAEQGEIEIGIKIAGRNINNLRDADNITLMA